MWLQATLLFQPMLTTGDADQAGARDVVVAGDGQLELGEAVAAAPREVRVAEHHALAGRGRVRRRRRSRWSRTASPGPCPARPSAPWRTAAASAASANAGRHRRRRQPVGRVGQRRRRGVGDLRHEHAGRGEQVGAVDRATRCRAAVTSGLHPRLVAAGRVGDVLRRRRWSGGTCSRRPRSPAPAPGSPGPGPAFGSASRSSTTLTVADVGEQRVGLQVRRVEGHAVVVPRRRGRGSATAGRGRSSRVSARLQMLVCAVAKPSP